MTQDVENVASRRLASPVSRSPSRDRNFLTYLAGVAGADVGDQAWLTALAFTAAQTGRPFTATLVVAAGTVPRALFALIGALHIPAIGTMPRQLVEPGELLKAASLRQLVQRLASLGGPALAGVVLAAVQLDGTVIGLIVIFGVAAVLLSLVRVRHPRQERADQPVLASIRDLLRYLRHNRSAGGLVAALVGLNIFVIPVVSVGVALRSNAEGWGPVTLGLLLGAIGFGAALGTIITLRIRPTYPLRFALLMLMVQGLALMSVGVAPRVGVGIAMAVVGLTSGLASPLLSGTLQATVEQIYLGRAFALISLSDNGLMPLALIGFGALAEGVGLGWSSAISGVCMVLLMLSAFVRPTLRRLRVDEEHGALA